jgi:ribonuclease P protein component
VHSARENPGNDIVVSGVGSSGSSNGGDEPRRGGARFPRSMRLLRHTDFERVYESGRRHFSASLTAFYLARPEAATAAANSGLRVGFTVGRALGGAVDRNRIKRRLRAAVRLSAPPAATAADVVINPKKSLLTLDFDALLNEVRRAFVVIEEKVGRETGDRTAKGNEAVRRKPAIGRNDPVRDRPERDKPERDKQRNKR